ncbi:hypothetical protein SANTM175S_08339 [Streptomyces antimycoticus]
MGASRTVAESIPSGRVMTYGDVAEWLEEGGPRQVGRVMALYGGAVPWWRVVRADGAPLPGHELRALDHYREEGTRCARRHARPRATCRGSIWPGRGGTGAGRTTAGSGAACGDATTAGGVPGPRPSYRRYPQP